MAEEFKKSVELGVKLSKRLYYGNQLIPPKKQTLSPTTSQVKNHLPTAPMVYAMVSNPGIVDNPDIRSYQPYVHGRCNPPALIALHMYDIKVEVECYVDVAFVSIVGSWRVHCVDRSTTCDCCVAIPMGEQQGSILGFEVEASSGSYLSQLANVEDTTEVDGFVNANKGGFLTRGIFTLKIPKVHGGSTLLVKARWSQKLTYNDGRFALTLPFRFPANVTPVGKFLSKEKIFLNVNSGTRTKVKCSSPTHPLMELRREDGKFGFLYEEEAKTWSKTDFEFSYNVSSDEIHGAMLTQIPPQNDFDQREIFTFYLFPESAQKTQVFKKRVIFLIDISRSMAGAPLENVKQAVLESLSKFNQDDSFNIIAFNTKTCMFSPSMEVATKETIERAREWFRCKLVADGGTNIMLPMKQALEMVSDESNAIPFICLVTDGAVENEKDICDVVKRCCASKKGLHFPRVSTFGIGSYCNQYFLRMLARIGRGRYDAAYDADSVSRRLQRFLTMSSSIIVSNIEIDCLNHIDLPMDLSYECPVIMSGRYKGKLPESLEIRGLLPDLSNFTTNVKIQEAKDTPLDKVYAQMRMDELTSIAWFTGNNELEKQVTEISMQTGFPSEYTRMILAKTQDDDQEPNFITIRGKEAFNKTSIKNMIKCRKLFALESLGVGFGDPKKTAENLPPGVTVKIPDTADKIVKAASGCCHQFLDRFCCMCFIQTVSKISDQFVITLSQICVALSCCHCLGCCYDLCSNCC